MPVSAARPSSPAFPLPLSTFVAASCMTASSTDMVGVALVRRGRGSFN